jgi:hypothetical protein
MHCQGFNQITNLSQVRTLGYGLPAGQPGGSNAALLQAEAAGVRWRDDGVAPTTTIGFLLSPGDSLYYDGAPVSRIQAIAATPGAILNVSFYTEGNV